MNGILWEHLISCSRLFDSSIRMVHPRWVTRNCHLQRITRRESERKWKEVTNHKAMLRDFDCLLCQAFCVERFVSASFCGNLICYCHDNLEHSQQGKRTDVMICAPLKDSAERLHWKILLNDSSERFVWKMLSLNNIEYIHVHRYMLYGSKSECIYIVAADHNITTWSQGF